MNKSATISQSEERGTLTYSSYKIRIVFLDNIPWFVAHDPCTAASYSIRYGEAVKGEIAYCENLQ